tara:strand:- start:129 stop:1202 length:1074 start_codon:yes stop_codon:yes gene_type:complete
MTNCEYYHCGRCGYRSKIKQCVLRHITRQSGCNPIIENIPACVLIKSTIQSTGPDLKNKGSAGSDFRFSGSNLKEGVHKKTHCYRCQHTFASKQSFEQHKCKGDPAHRYRCQICLKKYTTKKTLDHHACKGGPQSMSQSISNDTKTNAEVEKLKREIKELKEKLNSKPTVNNAITTNIQVNFINGFGNENLDDIYNNSNQIVDKLSESCKGDTVKFLTNMFTTIYYNPYKPENRCIRMSNVRGEYIEIDYKQRDDIQTRRVKNKRALELFVNKELGICHKLYELYKRHEIETPITHETSERLLQHQACMEGYDNESTINKEYLAEKKKLVKDTCSRMKEVILNNTKKKIAINYTAGL